MHNHEVYIHRRSNQGAAAPFVIFGTRPRKGLRYSKRAVSYSNEAYRVVKAVYGKLEERAMDLVVMTFFSVFNTTQMGNYKSPACSDSPTQQKITCYTYVYISQVYSIWLHSWYLNKPTFPTAESLLYNSFTQHNWQWVKVENHLHACTCTASKNILYLLHCRLQCFKHSHGYFCSPFSDKKVLFVTYIHDTTANFPQKKENWKLSRW